MSYFFFDCETTGFPNPNLPDEHEKQAHIVQLAGLLTSDSGGIEGAFNFLIKPSGWEISPEVSLIHGITTQKAIRFGVPIGVALSAFKSFAELSSLEVAHNHPFDNKMVRMEARRLGDLIFATTIREFLCTMTTLTPICQLPNARRAGQFKWPKLQEAYKFAFGKEFESAHDAMADVIACKALFFWAKEKNYISV